MATATEEYRSLVSDFLPRPIRSEREYRRALAYIDQHIQPKLPKAQGMFLELLATLVAQYESQMYPAPEASPADVLEHLIDERGLTNAELARATGIPRQTITNIVKGDRGISKANAIKLAKYFQVSPELFLAKISP
jgi:HTH-type transcriptional regulator/antitoxin HigA